MTPVAQTIYDQLGGHRFKVMTGASEFVCDPTYLRCKIGRNKTRANRLTVTLLGDDTYQVRFSRFTKKTVDYLPTYEDTETYCLDGVYAENLAEIFERYTGLYTSL